MDPAKELIDYVVRSECLDAIIWLIVVLIGLGIAWYSRRIPKEPNVADHEVANETGVLILGLCIATIGFMVLCVEGREAILSLLNPKYYTIETITKWRK